MYAKEPCIRYDYFSNILYSQTVRFRLERFPRQPTTLALRQEKQWLFYDGGPRSYFDDIISHSCDIRLANYTFRILFHIKVTVPCDLLAYWDTYYPSGTRDSCAILEELGALCLDPCHFSSQDLKIRLESAARKIYFGGGQLDPNEDIS